MKVVTIRELRNHGGDVLSRVAGGEAVTITRDGAEVAELRPLRRRSAPLIELIARRAELPMIDPVSLRNNVDEILAAGAPSAGRV